MSARSDPHLLLEPRPLHCQQNGQASGVEGRAAAREREETVRQQLGQTEVVTVKESLARY